MKNKLTKSLVLTCCMGIIFLSCNDSKNSSKDKPEESPKDTITITEDNPKHSEIESSNCCITVDADKTNVLYIGVNNPVTINSPKEVEISLSGEGTISDSAGKHIVRVTGGPFAYIIVKHFTDTSCRIHKKYKVKRIPDPATYVGNIKGDGSMTKGELQGQSGVFARMENFDFDVKFKVLSFNMSMMVNGVYIVKKSNGPALTPEMKSMLAGAKPGAKVLFEQVTVKGPDEITRKIPGVIISVR